VLNLVGITFLCAVSSDMRVYGVGSALC
jgi:hypothetical protein